MTSEMHIDEERMQRLLHGELATADAARSRRHLSECAGCRELFDEARRNEDALLHLLESVDHAAPALSPESIRAAAAGSGTAAGRAVSRGHYRAWRRWAAGIVLAIGAGSIAYAAPGSPLKALVRRVAGLVNTAPAPEMPPPAKAREAAPGGVIVEPGARFTIVFSGGARGAFANIMVADRAEIVVSVLEGNASFGSDIDGLTIAGMTDSALVEIELPRSAPLVEVRIGEERVFLLEGSVVETALTASPDGRYRLSLPPPR